MVNTRDPATAEEKKKRSKRKILGTRLESRKKAINHAIGRVTHLSSNILSFIQDDKDDNPLVVEGRVRSIGSGTERRSGY